MIYTLKEYGEIILKGKSIDTVKRRIRDEMLPLSHRVKKGKQWMIEVVPPSEKCKRCEDYFHASVEFNDRKKGLKVTTGEAAQFNFELAAEICVKYDLGATKFFKMHNLL